jgi:hypothetical protein
MWFCARLIFVFLSGVLVLPESPLDSKAKVIALVFISSECPVSNRMVPEIERLRRKFATKDVLVCVVYPNASDTETVIEKHRKEFRLQGAFIRDPEHKLVEKALIKITPEAAVFDEPRALVYRGRI